jgi:hypothetical protein
VIDEPWLSFYFAAQEIEERLGLSRGAAQAKLREACATGEVRSLKQPYVMIIFQPVMKGPRERIKPSEWRLDEIDLMIDADGYAYFVDVSERDFLFWLKTQKIEKSG